MTLQHVAAALVALALACAAAEDRADQQVLEHAHVRERMRDLIRAADAEARARVRRHRRHVGAGEHDAPVGRRDVAGDQVEHGGLAGAVRADHGQRLAVLDGEAHGVHGLERAVELGHAVKFQQDRHESFAAAAARSARRPCVHSP